MDANTLAALGEPSRLQIVELLRQRPFGVNELAETLGIRQPQASKHLKVLRDAGVVAVESAGRSRIHRLRSETFAELGDWVDSFEATWGARLDALGDHLDQTQEGSR